jgi:endogenous inhibitor of DNA gyrase (YacG/DUF329 family)
MEHNHKTLIIKCPQCSSEFNYYSKATRPFCSERCQMVDMGHWFEESYKVAGPMVVNQQDENEDEEN